MSTVKTVSIVIDDTTEIRVQTERGLGAELHLGDDVWIRCEYGANEVAVADSLYQAVLEWQHEIHRRAAERAGRSPAYCSHGERWNDSDPCTDDERAEAGR